jgi:hypothetical protein
MFKIIHKHWLYRWEKFYSRNKWHLILDLSLSTVIIVLISLAIGLNFYRPIVNLNTASSTPLINTPLDLNNPPLDFNANVASSTLNTEESALLKLSFKNNSSHPLSNLKFNLNVLTKNFTIDHLEISDQNNPEISVNGSELSLPDLPANLSGELSLKVYFKNQNSGTKEIDWQLNTSYQAVGQDLKANFALPTLNLPSVLNVEARAYYNSPQGDQLGAGPLPPLVALPTNYWIFIEAKADGDFNNFIYSAKLPKGVEVTGNRSILAGDFSYNKDLRQIIWRVPLLEANLSDYRAGFEVQLIPTADQLDKVLPLLNNAKYSAQESAGAKTKVSEEISSPDTNLEFDLINKGQGKVSK